MTSVAVQILGASFFSTHHAGAADAVAGRVRPVTPPAFPLLVARARRFTSLVTQMHIEVCGALPVDRAAPPTTVFATCQGEIQTADMLIADFRANAMVSSARFALSVHNTPSGLYSVATGSTAPSTTITGSNAIAAGWLEAALTALEADGNVILSIADEPVPAVFQGPSEPAGVAAAFLLAPAAGGSSPGRSAQLVMTPSTDDVEVHALDVLARAADAASGSTPATVRLGRIQPGQTLELRFG
ncbi:MAG: beta-ketoacyl synthase chain length factor [Deltaproteobacteria bacterium]|nr:beta-ketoacyl synthase chain length factor [Deltaproteobacteria bacterium]